MANARTRFDTIREYMVRSHRASSGTLYGKPCAMLDGHAFLYFHQDWAAFLLKGRVRLQALALPGARFWDPMGREGASMDWVIVPDAHFLRWDRLAIEAVKVAHKHGEGRRPVAGPAEGPVPPPPAARRWINSIKSLLAKAADLTLSKQEPLPERKISRLFSETASDLDAQAANEIAALAEPESAVADVAPAAAAALEPVRAPITAQPTAPPISPSAPTTPPPGGRASFAIDEQDHAAPPSPPSPAAPAGRASFAIDEADRSEPEPAAAKPPAPPAGRASFAIDEADHSVPEPEAAAAPAEPPQKPPPKAAYSGRASFLVGSDPEPPPTPAASDREATAAQSSAPRPPVKPLVSGRASFQIDAVDHAAPAATPAEPRPAAPPADHAKPDSPPASVSEPAAADEPAKPDKTDPWADKIAQFSLVPMDEAEEETSDAASSTATPAAAGRATFAVQEPQEPAAAKPGLQIKEPERPLGRASFSVAEDPPPAPRPVPNQSE
ncbi:MAG: hypothetical protein KDI71_19410 [Xanthomonadales bacterium]|nr:hypothetical protein [Xanthomonadales bacterium]